MILNKKISMLIAFLLLTACQQGVETANMPTVIVAQGKMETIAKTASYAGTVTTVEAIELLPRIQGYLKERRFEQGQMVHTGDVLFVIEQDQYQAMVMQKEADLEAAKATLAERTLNLERMNALYEKRVVAAANQDQAESDFLNAKAQVQATQAALKNAQLDLSYTIISAPIDGRISVTKYSPGDYLSPTTPTLATIVQLDPIRVVFSIPEQEWLAVEELQQNIPEKIYEYLKPQLKLSNGSIYKNSGKISFVDNHIDPNTGSLAVYATFENPNYLLLPGQFVTVTIQIGEPKEVLTVPNAAVLFDKTGHFMFLVDDQHKIEKRYVKVGDTQNNRIEITEGIDLQTIFISQGLQKVMPGMQVHTKTKDGAA